METVGKRGVSRRFVVLCMFTKIREICAHLRHLSVTPTNPIKQTISHPHLSPLAFQLSAFTSSPFFPPNLYIATYVSLILCTTKKNLLCISMMAEEVDRRITMITSLKRVTHSVPSTYPSIIPPSPVLPGQLPSPPSTPSSTSDLIPIGLLRRLSVSASAKYVSLCMYITICLSVCLSSYHPSCFHLYCP